MSHYACPTCGAKGVEHCTTPLGRDHASRWHLEDDTLVMRSLVANHDVGFRDRGIRTNLHIWVSETEKRPLTARERRALLALVEAREVERVYAVGNSSRGAYHLKHQATRWAAQGVGT